MKYFIILNIVLVFMKGKYYNEVISNAILFSVSK